MPVPRWYQATGSTYEDHEVNKGEELDLASKVKLITEIPLLSRIGPDNIAHLAASSDVLRFSSGHILFRQGDIGKEAYIIISGEAEVITEGPEGEISVATIGQHEFVGEIALLVDVPRTATVVASGDLSTLMVSKEMFYHMVVEYPTVAIEVMRELANRLLATTARLRETSSDMDTIHLSG